MMRKKLTPESLTNSPLTGVGLMSGFGTPKEPPGYNLEGHEKSVPKEDTHPGTGILRLNGRAGNPDADGMLGEGD